MCAFGAQFQGALGQILLRLYVAVAMLFAAWALIEVTTRFKRS